MHTASLKALLCILFLLLSVTWGVRPVSAQTQFTIGTCVGTDAATFADGLTLTPTTQGVVVQGIVAGCVYGPGITAPVPASFTWNTVAQNAGCVTLYSQLAPGTGTITWTDGSTSGFTLTTNVASIGIVGLTPQAFFFAITSGRGSGGYFIVNADLISALSDVTSCLDGSPVYTVTGINLPVYVALPTL